jgi:hypothetical protein
VPTGYSQEDVTSPVLNQFTKRHSPVTSVRLEVLKGVDVGCDLAGRDALCTSDRLPTFGRNVTVRSPGWSYRP